MSLNEVEVRRSSSMSVKSGFHAGLKQVQNKLDKVSNADKSLPPKPAVRFHEDESKKQLQKKFYRHYRGPEKDLVSIKNSTGLAISLPPSIALFAAGFSYCMSLGLDVSFGEASLQALVMVIVSMLAIVFPLASIIDNGPVVSFRNKTIYRKRYRRELNTFVSVERQKAALYDAAIRKRDKKIESIRKSLEPLSAQYSQSNPGKRLSFNGDTLQVSEYEDKATKLSNVELLAARVASE